jgi:hypothetical protein
MSDATVARIKELIEGRRNSGVADPAAVDGCAAVDG